VPAVTIAVDAMGGDHAPDEIVVGAAEAARASGVEVVLVGATDRLQTALTDAGLALGGTLSLVEAPEYVQMDEAPLAALRRKPKASIKVACELLKAGRVQAVVSAGHTGASLVAARTVLGLLPGVERAALAVTVPTATGSAVLIDAGANVDCRPEHLVQFGLMGAAYARVALGRDEPSVGLLSIGEEAGKGPDVVRDAHARLAQTRLRFIGNIEARDIFTGLADVIVCDGFAGNVVLKVGEGVAVLFEALLRQELMASPTSRLGAWLSRPAFQQFRRRVDDAERGAAPLVGVAGLVLVGHGRSSSRAVRNAVATAVQLVEAELVERTKRALSA
jgi:glycerol-3-phosphate acyltransferase PlsX